MSGISSEVVCPGGDDNSNNGGGLYDTPANQSCVSTAYPKLLVQFQGTRSSGMPFEGLNAFLR